MRVCFVGAGLSCAIVARAFAEADHHAIVIDERRHIAGNCHSERDRQTGIMLHRYGPHIFHTSREDVWRYVTSFCEMMPYITRLKAVSQGRVYSFPVNLHTINQFFGAALSPNEAKAFIARKARADIEVPRSFEEQALRFVGPEIYDAFFRGYAAKQWGRDPKNLPASILQRLPIRFTYDDNYFNHKYQGIPKQGYTALVDRILAHPRIEVRLGVRSEDILAEPFDHTFYSGPIDRFFEFREGRLPYRTLDFEELRAEGDYQGAAVISYCDEAIAFNRITEHKHFSPWEADQFPATVCFREYSREAQSGDIPYYPVRLLDGERLLKKYVAMATSTVSNTTFIGRLGTYRYLDMDVCVAEALEAAARAVELVQSGAPLPVFFSAPV